MERHDYDYYDIFWVLYERFSVFVEIGIFVNVSGKCDFSNIITNYGEIFGIFDKFLTSIKSICGSKFPV